MVTNAKIVLKLALIYKDKLLVIKRSPHDVMRADCWDFPGGNIDDTDVDTFENKILIRTLVRETMEEIGVKIDVEQIEVLYVGQGDRSDTNKLFIWIVYKMVLDKIPEVRLSGEHSEYLWVGLDEISDLKFGDISNLYSTVAKKALN